jgi:hypothetical protein
MDESTEDGKRLMEDGKILHNDVLINEQSNISNKNEKEIVHN